LIKLTVSGSFPDLDRHWIEVECPHCRLETPALLRDVRIGGVIICRGCKANIRLVDHLGGYQRARQRFAQAFEQMFSAFRK
jgi:hypothetical protein